MKGKGQMIYFPEDVWKKLKRLKNKSAKVSGLVREFYAKAGQDEGK